MRTLFKNWWTILIEGILLIILSVIIFNNPNTVLTTLAVWLGLIILVGGITGIISFLLTSKASRQNSFLITSLIIAIIGGAMIANSSTTERVITIMFGITVAALGAGVISDSWNAKGKWNNWWITFILGIVALIVGVSSIFQTTSGAQTISLLMGISVLSSGLGMIIIAFVKRNVELVIKNALKK
ncbi:MAG: DUF308 domain-containing protein [Chitinophagales bacterium]|nr:DUF308 domain-containing protein [Chitinophagales bacterium]MBP8753713.1 DUF308 domain-containing protein [Chitinophagales bacterium]MBP9189341.1 DUF308 domain-containing protein [Chitinophagales bacterium]MBP9548739.1 DUF308 domain-containing protein [Chitinophagales bacterium]MBP9703160.1 DUF308 domain-containing protein [Chitinophagales bacterium]